MRCNDGIGTGVWNFEALLGWANRGAGSTGATVSSTVVLGWVMSSLFLSQQKIQTVLKRKSKVGRRGLEQYRHCAGAYGSSDNEDESARTDPNNRFSLSCGRSCHLEPEV